LLPGKNSKKSRTKNENINLPEIGYDLTYGNESEVLPPHQHAWYFVVVSLYFKDTQVRRAVREFDV
jgi:hypothetical protein